MTGLAYTLGAVFGPVCHNEPWDWAKGLFFAPYVLVLGLLLPLVFVLLIEPKLWRPISLLLLAFTAHLPLSIAGCVAGQSAHWRKVEALSERCAPILAAIESFESRTGHPPSGLAELGPLSAALARELAEENVVLDYARASHEHPEMRWRLLITVDWVSWLFYLPDGAYPRYFRGGPVERIDAWAYAQT